MPQDNVQELIRNFGKDFEALKKRILIGNENDLIDFTNDIAIAIRAYPSKPLNRFEFIASESLSGGRYPCSYAKCRFNKLDELVAFATFYADTVYVQDPFEKVLLKESESISNVDRDDILFGVLTYLRLKPLIDKGIVKFGHSLISICESHKKLLADPLNQKEEQLEKVIHAEITSELIENCNFEFGITESGVHFIELIGPEMLVAHGKQYFHLYELPEYLKNISTRHNLPYRLTNKDIIKSKIT